MLQHLLHVHKEDFDEIFFDYFRSETIDINHSFCAQFQHIPEFKNENVSIRKVVLKEGLSYDGLIEALLLHIVHYTGSEGLKPDKQVRLAKRQFMRYKKLTANTPFSNISRLREIGEFILYFLAESALGYPMLISKMRMKTNTNMPVYGSDGIFIGIDKDGELKIYLGEAKISNSLDSAKSDARDSFKTTLNPETLQDKDINVLGREQGNWNTQGNTALEEKLESLINPYFEEESPSAEFDFNIVCLLGYECENYKKCLMNEEEWGDYLEKVRNHIKYLFRYFEGVDGLGDRKIEIILLPLFDHEALIRQFLTELNRG